MIASAFIEGTTKEGLNKPYLVYLTKRPFAFAGIWDTWLDPETEETINSFAIITTSANELLQKIPHHRMPVILSDSNYRHWLHSGIDLGRITSLLKQYPAKYMNAYPISPEIKSPKNNSKELLKPTGPIIAPQFESNVTDTISRSSYGHKKKKDDPQRPTMAERINKA